MNDPASAWVVSLAAVVEELRMIWPVAVALGHGLHCSRADGTPLVYNRADTYMPDLLVCRKEHAQLVLDALAKMDATA